MNQCVKCNTMFEGNFCPNCGTQFTTPQLPPLPPQTSQYIPNQINYYQQPQPKKSNWLKWVLIGVGSLIVGFVLLLVVTAALTDDETVDQTGQTKQEQVIMGTVSIPVFADQVNPDTQEPKHQLTTITSTQPKIIAVAKVNAKKGSTVEIKWYANDEHVPSFDWGYTFEDDYTGWASSTLTLGAGKSWPVATYKVVYYIDGQPKTQKEFTIK